MKIPLLDLKAQHDPIQKEILEAIRELVSSQSFILGPDVKKLEDRIADYCQTKFAIGVSSGQGCQDGDVMSVTSQASG